jgi:hypothetical protein
VRPEPRQVEPLLKSKPKTQRGTYGRGAKAKATKLHSLLVRSRGMCQRCGERDYSKLQCAHIVSRRFSATRTDENNAWCLCARCHMHLTTWPNEHVAFAWATHGEDGYAALREKALSNLRPWKPADWQAEVERLEALLGGRDG